MNENKRVHVHIRNLVWRGAKPVDRAQIEEAIRSQIASGALPAVDASETSSKIGSAVAHAMQAGGGQ